MNTPDLSPVSFRANVRKLPARGMVMKLAADDAQCLALAEAHGLLTVENWQAELLVKTWKRDGISVTGRVKAEVTAACVVTLEPVPQHIDEAVEAVFVPETSRLADAGEGGEILLDSDGPDAPETFTGSEIDVGALAEEFFALALDPYPRAAKAPIAAEPEPLKRENPFAKLAKLKENP